MASVDTRDVPDQYVPLTVKDTESVRVEFAEEAFQFLLNNAHIWIEYPKNFVIRFTYSEMKDFRFFSEGMAKAIVVIAYLHRMEYRTRDWHRMNPETDLSHYEDCVKSYSFPKKSNYFYHYLTWIAFIFDLTMYCYKKGYDYTKRGEQFIADYPATECFLSKVGMYYFLLNAKYIGEKYREAVPICSQGKFKDEDIKHFIKRLENIERRNRYSNRWVISPKMSNSRRIRRKLSAKYSLVLRYDTQRVTSGYRVIPKKSTTKSTLKFPTKSPKVQVSETQKFNSGEKDGLAAQMNEICEEITADHVFAESEMESSFSWDTEDSNSVFIVHERFLTRRNSSRSQYKRGLKICSLSMDSDVLVPNLNKILETNLDKKCYMKVDKCVYAVSSPLVSIDNEDTLIIVLDTSSEEEEEEDDSCPKQFHEIADVIWPKYMKGVRTNSESIESVKEGSKTKYTIDELMAELECVPSKSIELELKESASGMTTEQESEQSQISESISLEGTNRILTEISSEQIISVSSKSTEAVSKESDIVVHIEQKPLVVTKCTGTKSKVRKTVLKRRPRKGCHTDSGSSDSEDSDQNNERM